MTRVRPGDWEGGWAFANKSALSHHMRTHTGDCNETHSGRERENENKVGECGRKCASVRESECVCDM